jgi:hypothetical protein
MKKSSKRGQGCQQPSLQAEQWWQTKQQLQDLTAKTSKTSIAKMGEMQANP